MFDLCSLSFVCACVFVICVVFCFCYSVNDLRCFVCFVYVLCEFVKLFVVLLLTPLCLYLFVVFVLCFVPVVFVVMCVVFCAVRFACH